MTPQLNKKMATAALQCAPGSIGRPNITPPTNLTNVDSLPLGQRTGFGRVNPDAPPLLSQGDEFSSHQDNGTSSLVIGVQGIGATSETNVTAPPPPDTPAPPKPVVETDHPGDHDPTDPATGAPTNTTNVVVPPPPTLPGPSGTFSSGTDTSTAQDVPPRIPTTVVEPADPSIQPEPEQSDPPPSSGIVAATTTFFARAADEVSGAIAEAYDSVFNNELSFEEMTAQLEDILNDGTVPEETRIGTVRQVAKDSAAIVSAVYADPGETEQEERIEKGIFEKVSEAITEPARSLFQQARSLPGELLEQAAGTAGRAAADAARESANQLADELLNRAEQRVAEISGELFDEALRRFRVLETEGTARAREILREAEQRASNVIDDARTVVGDAESAAIDVTASLGLAAIVIAGAAFAVQRQ